MSKGFDSVVWSGGADSTLALTMKAKNTTEVWPVYALVVDMQPQIHVRQLANQRAARKRYLAWAKKRGYHIKLITLKVEYEGEPHKFWGVDGGGQKMIWLSHLAPYFQDDAEVHLGYIKHDATFWHFRREFEDAFHALAKMAQTTWKLEMPLEWYEKAKVLEQLKEHGVPNNCWWSCESPKTKGRPCRTCNKCRELKAGRAEMLTPSRLKKMKVEKKR